MRKTLKKYVKRKVETQKSYIELIYLSTSHCDGSSRELHKSVKVTQKSNFIGFLWDYLDKKKTL